MVEVEAHLFYEAAFVRAEAAHTVLRHHSFTTLSRLTYNVHQVVGLLLLGRITQLERTTRQSGSLKLPFVRVLTTPQLLQGALDIVAQSGARTLEARSQGGRPTHA